MPGSQHWGKKVFLSPLSRQYLIWTMLFGTFISLVITSTEIYGHYVGTRNELATNLNRVSATYLSGLSRSLWEYHEVQAQLILDGIAHDERVSGVEVQSDVLSLHSGVIPASKDVIKSEVPVYIEANGKSNFLGELVLYADMEWVIQQVYHFALNRLLSNFIKSTLLLLFGFFSFRLLVNQHLEAISRFVISGKTLRTPLEKLEMERNTLAYAGWDEIDEVAHGINQLGHELQHHIGQIVTMTREAEVVNLRLLEAMRMEALGKQVSSITHEFNNSLTIISGAIELIAASEALPQEVRERVRVAEASVQNACQLTKQLLTYSAKPELLNSALRMDEFSTELEAILAVLVNKKNNLLVLCMTRTVVYVNREMLLSSLINLVKNANEALAGNGNISVIIRNLSAQNKIKYNLDTEKNYIVIDVMDNGPGVPQSRRDQLFEPFVTTKADQGGTGLGLWTLYNFTKQISGQIIYADAANGGSHFSLILPTHPDKVVVH